MNDQPISKSARNCEALFNSLRTAPCHDASSARKAESLLQNFYVWASFLGVFAPETASLDRRLHDAHDVRDLVLQLLSLISDDLTWAISHQNGWGHEWEQQLNDTLGSVRKAMDRLELLGNLIRHASTSSRERKVQKFAIKHRDIISERWMLTILEHLYRDAPASLREQVNNSISHSRYRLSYTRKHQEKLDNIAGRNKTEIKDSKVTLEGKTDVSRAKKVTFDERPSVLRAEESTTPHRDVSAPPPSHTDATTWTQPDQSEIDKAMRPTSRSYARSNATFIPENLDNYPAIPPRGDDRTVVCPYCNHPLSKFELTVRGWRRHWEDDFRPYVCMSEDCPDPKCFSRIEEWRTHMCQHSFNWISKVHTEKHWACDIDHEILFFHDESKLRRHIHDIHGNLYDASELEVMAEMSLETQRRNPSVCPLCTASIQPMSEKQDRPSTSTAAEADPEDQTSEQYEAMLKHLEGHLRQLALKSWDRLKMMESDSVDSEVDGQMDPKTDPPPPSNESNASNVPKAPGDLKSQFSNTNLEQYDLAPSTWLDPEYEKMETAIEPPVEHVDWNRVYAMFSPDRLISIAETSDERDWGDAYRRRRREDFSVALICVLPIELDAIALAFDEIWEENQFGKEPGDDNSYTLGRIGSLHAVLVLLPHMNKGNPERTTTSLRQSFPLVKIAFLCGLCGGVPNPSHDVEILLGDVIISGNVIQYDNVRQYPSKLAHEIPANDAIRSLLGHLAKQSGVDKLRDRTAIMMERIQRKIVENDQWSKYARPGIETNVLFQADYLHRHRQKPDCICDNDTVCDEAIDASCADLQCDPEYHVLRGRLDSHNAEKDRRETTPDTSKLSPQIFVGPVGSGDTVMKSGQHRDMIAQEHGIIAFEIDVTSVLEDIPCAIIKSVCDYADSHKNKEWQRYAAVVAASALKAVLYTYSFAPTAFIVPFNENPDFVGRSEVLAQVQNLFGHSDHYDGPDSKARSRVALYGLGGVGKTQIALAYCYWFRDRFPDASVFWVFASNTNRFQKAFSDIARECGIPGRHDKEVDILLLVKEWLENEQSGQWLLVIDNADDMEAFFPTSLIAEAGRRTTSIGDSIPNCSHGSVLITTRNKQAGVMLSLGHPPIEVSVMTGTEATQLFQKLLEDDSVTSAEASLVSSRLANLPLALAQAASFIFENSLSIKTYVGLLDESDSSLVDRLSEPFEVLGRDSGTPHTLTATWNLSFNQIEKQNPTAGNVLHLMSLFDDQAIPRQFIWDYCRERRRKASYSDESLELDGDSENDSQVDIDLEVANALKDLRAFSFISKADGDSFDMHRLVQLVTRKRLADNGKMSHFATAALNIVRKAFPWATHENRVLCIQLVPHALAVLEHAEVTRGVPLEDDAQLSRQVGRYFRYEGHYEFSKQFLLRSVRVHREFYGSENSNTSAAMSDLVSLYIDMMRLEEGLNLARSVLELDERLRPKDTETILNDKILIATCLNGLGLYEEAEKLCLEVWTKRKGTLGEEHPGTLRALDGVVDVYRATDRLEEAQKLCIRLVELTRKIMGEEHPTTLHRMGMLSKIHAAQGNYNQAEQLVLETVEARRRTLGETHIHTILSLRQLSELYHELGRVEDGNKVHLRLLEAERAVSSVQRAT